jgi:hypothetical protein
MMGQNQHAAPARRLHWSEAQLWRNLTTNETLPAGELLEQYRSELRGVSLCCATFDVRAGGATWRRIS